MKPHPMDINTNTRVRWDVLARHPLMWALAGKRVLDVGAGLGYFSARFAERGAEVLAIDVDKDALGYLSETFGIRTQVVDVERDPLPDAEFDIVFIGEILEHVDDPATLLGKAVTVLAPGGHLIVTTPALEGALIHTKGKRLGHEDGSERHARDGFRYEELAGLCAQQGLRVVYHVFSLFFASELFMQLTKLAYMKKSHAYHRQSDVIRQVRSAPYRIMRAFYPLLMLGFRAEQAASAALGLKGHCHIVIARKD